MFGKVSGIALILFAFAACDIAEKPIVNKKGIVTKGQFKRAVRNSDSFVEVPMRGQALQVSRATVGARDYAVLKFVQKFTTRRDQPDMSSEVLPAVERVTGCSIDNPSAFGPGYFMPRERDVVIPLACGAGTFAEPVADLATGPVVEPELVPIEDPVVELVDPILDNDLQPI